MTKVTRITFTLLATLPLAFPPTAQGQAGAAPKTAAICLPPGGQPVACGTARAGQTIRLRVATTNLPTGPITLLFAEQAAAGQAARSASLTIPPERSRDGGYDVPVPTTLCAGTRGTQAQYEIQHLMSTFNQSETVGAPLGTLTVAC